MGRARPVQAPARPIGFADVLGRLRRGGSVNDGYLGYKVLWALVPAMAMVMIDFTIVSISATEIQHDLSLTETGVQWLVTAYPLATAAFVALGGRLGDVLGHRTIVILGVFIFAASSAM